MNTKTILMYSALLHDVGKIVSRSSRDSRPYFQIGKEFMEKIPAFKSEPLLESIRYHRFDEIEKVKLANDSLAYIVAMANEIASVVDGKEGANMNTPSDENRKTLPLHSIFNIINRDDEAGINSSSSLSNSSNTENEESAFQTGVYTFDLNKTVRYPTTEKITYTMYDYKRLRKRMNNEWRKMSLLDESYFSSFLQWIETYWSYVPNDISEHSLLDISLYDHSKLTSAVAVCIYDFLTEKNITDYSSLLTSGEKNYFEEEMFLLTSLDMSGIQDFIYSISGKDALKSLRTRSFYIEVMLEVIIDELLRRLSLSRAHLLYTGGGHAYLLLPNTEHAQKSIAQFHNELRQWFIEEFTTDLSMSIAHVACTGYDLMNHSGRYQTIWQQLTRKLSEKKAQKYTIDDIIALNSRHSEGERECRECLRSDNELNGNQLCEICQQIINISNDLRDNDYFVVSENGKLKLPFDQKLSVINKTIFEQLDIDGARFFYTKNNESPVIRPNITANLWMCDYDFASQDPEMRSLGIASYANRKRGVKRLGVLRADVDNLGMTFIQGIPKQYQSLLRTTMLSRQLSMFFKYELSEILEGAKITVIYAGGDDLFLIGAWDEIVTKAVGIRKRFKEFTLDRLTFSAGIGIFPAKYPVSRMAEETGILVDEAKQGEKNKMTLWTIDKTYDWETFNRVILQEKLPIIRKTIEESEDHGRNFVFNMFQYFNEANQINIARFAYSLARSNVPEQYASLFFKWIRDEEARNHFITALGYYIYEIREV